MAEESLKDEIRAALSRRLVRQPRNLLSTEPAREAEKQKKSPRERGPRLFARLPLRR
jgi:hypothetical protein